MSGVPEILAVKRIEPVARAEIGRPEGDEMMCRDSRMSTYSSLEVWRTFGRRQGIEGWLENVVVGLRAEDREDGPPRTGPELESSVGVCGEDGRHTLVYQLD